MKKNLSKPAPMLAAVCVCLLVGLVTLSFQDTPFVKAILDNQEVEPQDSTPIKKKKQGLTMKEFEQLSVEPANQVFDEMKTIDFSQIERSVLAGLQDADINKIMKEVEASLKQIDTHRMLADIQHELMQVNHGEMSAEVKQAVASANMEIEKAMQEVKKIDREKIKIALEQAKLEAEKSRHEFEKIDMKKIMKDARLGIDKARAELKQLREMFNEMEKDGLIQAKQGFKIEYRDKNLYIDGNRQPERVADKYRKYFKEEHFEITIEKE